MTQIDAGGTHYACAVLAGGSVKCWGRKTGDKNIVSCVVRQEYSWKAAAFAIPGLSNVTRVAVGDGHACALLESGVVKCWGENYSCQAGGGGDACGESAAGGKYPFIVEVAGLANVVQLAAAGYHACAQLESGVVKCWGDNRCGQLGDGQKSAMASKPPFDKKKLSRCTPVTVSVLAGGH